MRWKVRTLCSALLLLAFLPGGTAEARGRHARVAVHQLLPGGLELSEEKLAALSYLAGTRFAETAMVEIVPWDEIYTYLKTQDMILCFDRNCQMDVERKLDADYTLALQILPMGRSCHLTATLYPRGESASLRSALVKGGCGEDALVTGIEQLMERIAAQGHLRPRAEARAGGPPEEVAAKAGAGEGRGERPSIVVVGSMLYSPAPFQLYESDGLQRAKSPDLYGPWMAVEVRVGEFGSLGLQTSLLFAEDSVLLTPALRLGVFFEIVEHFSLYGRLMTGMAYYYHGSEPACGSPPCASKIPADYLGLNLGLGGGVRYMFLEHLGFQFELAGGSDILWLVDKDGRGDPRGDLCFIKLELAIGILGAW